ncbi:MAG: hypothetical protein K0S45_769 [Nitrospira sp.]|nr:hypothetical protein [Nitrospira sp.]
MTITVIIPVLNEAGRIAQTLSRTVALGFDEVLVVDGGSDDQTCSIVRSFIASLGSSSLDVHSSARCSIRLSSAPPGRARQLNAGAAASLCDVLLFLHADTDLPLDARHAVENALSDPTYVGGRFNVRFDSNRLPARIIGGMMNVRSRRTGIATGDQAIFVRREVFERIGRFSDIPLMEDVEFTSRLKRAGRLAPLTENVVTAFRRWDTNGLVRTILLMWTLRFLYWIGVSPHRLQRFYGMVR